MSCIFSDAIENIPQHWLDTVYYSFKAAVVRRLNVLMGSGVNVPQAMLGISDLVVEECLSLNSVKKFVDQRLMQFGISDFWVHDFLCSCNRSN